MTVNHEVDRLVGGEENLGRYSASSCGPRHVFGLPVVAVRPVDLSGWWQVLVWVE